MRDFLSITNLSPDNLEKVLRRALQFKNGAVSAALEGRSVALLFEKPSLRTRLSFDLAVQHLGGYSIYLSREEVGIGHREQVADIARVLERYVHIIVARVNRHQTLVTLAKNSIVPVVNALSDVEHPCQALADLLTVHEHMGTFQDITLAYVGDGNNVAVSLALACASAGVSLKMAFPKGYELDIGTQKMAEWQAQSNGVEISFVETPEEAIEQSDVVYTDVWTSMGQEKEIETRKKAFSGYTVTPELMEKAKPHAVFMHPLPAHYGEELDLAMQGHPQSVVFQQAENRLYTQKAVLEWLLEVSS